MPASASKIKDFPELTGPTNAKLSPGESDKVRGDVSKPLAMRTLNESRRKRAVRSSVTTNSYHASLPSA